MFDRDLRATLPSLTSAPVQAQHLRDKLAASRDRAQGRRKNVRAVEFQVGEQCLMWCHRDKRYKIPVTILAPNQGLDGAARSYWVSDDGGKSRLVHVSWLVKVPEQPEPAQHLA